MMTIMPIMPIMPISMIIRHLTGIKSVFFGFKPLEHSLIVAEVGGRTVSNGAAGQGSAVWLSCSFDGNASAVHGVETHQGEVECGHVQLHTAFVVTLKVPNQALRYSNWQSFRFPWSPIVVMISTVVIMSTAFHDMVVAGVAVVVVVVAVVVVVFVVVAVVMVVVSTAFHDMVVAVVIVVVVLVVVVAVVVVVFVVVAVVMVVAVSFSTVFHVWWRQFECTSGCCACVGGVAPPVDAKLVLVTMVVYVTI